MRVAFLLCKRRRNVAEVGIHCCYRYAILLQFIRRFLGCFFETTLLLFLLSCFVLEWKCPKPELLVILCHRASLTAGQRNVVNFQHQSAPMEQSYGYATYRHRNICFSVPPEDTVYIFHLFHAKIRHDQVQAVSVQSSLTSLPISRRRTHTSPWLSYLEARNASLSPRSIIVYLLKHGNKTSETLLNQSSPLRKSLNI